MTGFLDELGKRLADRWVAAVILPGLLYAAVATVAVTVRQSHWWDLSRVTRLGVWSGDLGDIAAPLIGLVLVALAAGTLSQALGGPVQRLLAGRWWAVFRPLSTRLLRSRKQAWAKADQEYRAEEAKVDGRSNERLAALAQVRNRIALLPPACPTWLGDRLRAPAVRVHNEYGLDLATTWPRLWLLLPESTRQPLIDGRQRFDDANAIGGSAILYLLLGLVWWPSAVIGVTVAMVAWRRCKATADVYAELVEATVDIHLADLLARLTDGAELHPLRSRLGREITERFRKGI
jgi:hypothetical protein